VTGAARGIGYALVQALAERPDTVIYAGVRSFPVDTNSELGQLAAKHPDTVFPIKITSADEADNQAAAALIKKRYSQVDCVIACAGMFLLSLFVWLPRSG
jgi:NAD(P)-dependent dehydrogenase (short-subunit alcohol dehydrogenase family)